MNKKLVNLIGWAFMCVYISNVMFGAEDRVNTYVNNMVSEEVIFENSIYDDEDFDTHRIFEVPSIKNRNK